MRPGAIAPEVAWHILLRPGNRLLQVQPTRRGIIGGVTFCFLSSFYGVSVHGSRVAATGDGPAQDFHATGLSFVGRQGFLTSEHIGI